MKPVTGLSSTRRLGLPKAITCLLLMMFASCTLVELRPYSSPPTNLQNSALAGNWEAHYSGMGSGVDRLVLRDDGTFQQTYDDLKGYVFTSGWDAWRIEQFTDGRMWLHLAGARYYREGITIGERGGVDACPKAIPQCPPESILTQPFYDPDTSTSVNMVGELLLKIKMDTSSGELVLEHFRTGIDDVKVISENHEFHRKDGP